ncbi:hypothetical protein B0H13DRAFT_2321865 [Mycena leptocephala]|nr:hypothetical protein B0H13DRAFT_2321865 [Mycena leptocephala]
MAAWNYQNILLCSIPVVEGLLLEPFNSEILDLLFTLAEWHTLAKLKLHTDITLSLLDSTTTILGRGRRQATKAAQGKGRATNLKTTANAKEFNLHTYKLHSLGDYASSGELEHRRDKAFYARTNKNKAVRQMTQLERRNTTLLRIASRAHSKAKRRVSKTTPTPVAQGHKKTHISFAASESLPYTAPEQHYHISPSRNFSFHLTAWLRSNQGDPAVTEFLPKLQEHLLSRFTHPDWTGDGNEFTPAQRFRLILTNERIYMHKILRINYTTYDVRRGQDCLNPRTHSDVMYLTPEEDAPHPFGYAQIIGVFHADVVNTADRNSKPQSMEFLRKRYHRIEFVPQSDPDAFGFLNPDEFIRGAHILAVAHLAYKYEMAAWETWGFLVIGHLIRRHPSNLLSHDFVAIHDLCRRAFTEESEDVWVKTSVQWLEHITDNDLIFPTGTVNSALGHE